MVVYTDCLSLARYVLNMHGAISQVLLYLRRSQLCTGCDGTHNDVHEVAALSCLYGALASAMCHT
jgi:hypothetical protein